MPPATRRSRALLAMSALFVASSLAGCLDRALGLAAAPPAPRVGFASGPVVANDGVSGRLAVLGLAVADLECPHDKLEIVAKFERDATNITSLRYLVEGCGQRGLYVEQCGTDTCRYFLASRLSLHPATVPAAASHPDATTP